MSPAASDLAMVLTRGLSLEHQKSSRDSLQYSSGYSTQTTTPSCSEDTIPSQGTATRGTWDHVKWHLEWGRAQQRFWWSGGAVVCAGCHSTGLWSRCVGLVPQITTAFPGYLGASWASAGAVVPGSAITGDVVMCLCTEVQYRWRWWQMVGDGNRVSLWRSNNHICHDVGMMMAEPVMSM